MAGWWAAVGFWVTDFELVSFHFFDELGGFFFWAMTVFGHGSGIGFIVSRSLGVRLGYLSAFLGMNE
jgi:hypothetical protein